MERINTSSLHLYTYNVASSNAIVNVIILKVCEDEYEVPNYTPAIAPVTFVITSDNPIEEFRKMLHDVGARPSVHMAKKMLKDMHHENI